ncbi:MAG: hypothetical protein DRJ51_04865 [Thermoprotei archaeon]|nr:MAG: hypothetical protein DRJ51_04865 [Thermoprotei archaeon]
MDIWERLEEKFGRSSKKMLVAKTIFKYGLRIDDKGQIFLGDIKIPYTSIAKPLGVDRRTVKETVFEILGDNILKDFFKNLEPAGPFLRRVSRILNYRCIAVEVFEDRPGILAKVSGALAKRDVNVVQVIAEDPNLVENPKLYVIVKGEPPGEAISEILRDPNTKSVTIT